MRFIIDAQLPPGLATFLTSHGFEVQHVSRIGLGAASDNAIWQRASETGAHIFTKDEDFVRMARLTLQGPGVVWIRTGNITNQALNHALAPLLDQIVGALQEGERLIEVR